ncbi:hypothetical protein [Nannocystis punicea]|uniref:Uncharacterized protein n=1 Tax=Nannocystis punicea TaxID=2995304 RepID=A0ABY7H6U1_9BACT|nr:hypothetical protein [Nannocystis poenicansa]WAS94986.1 hypothetical protein O0S08_02390 [Nannocystis poenicansa]
MIGLVLTALLALAAPPAESLTAELERALAGAGEPGVDLACEAEGRDLARDGAGVGAALERLVACHAAAGRLDDARRWAERLLVASPSSAAATLVALGRRSLDLGRLELAAWAFESEPRARRVPAEQLERLWQAAEIRLGLGQLDLVAADLDAIDRGSAHDPGAAAEWFWRRREWIGAVDRRLLGALWGVARGSGYYPPDPYDLQLAHARAYLRRHAKAGGLARRAITESTIGKILWDNSCSEWWSGLCVKLQWRMPRATSCGRGYITLSRKRTEPPIPRERRPIRAWCTPRTPLLEQAGRDPAGAREAIRHFDRALRLARGVSLAAEDPLRPEFEAALAIAELRTLDAAVEDYLGRELPEDLRLAPDRWLHRSSAPEDRQELRRQMAQVEVDVRRRYPAFLAERAAEADALEARLLAFADRAGGGRFARDAWWRAGILAAAHARSICRVTPVGGFFNEDAARLHADDLDARRGPLLAEAQAYFERCTRDGLARSELDGVFFACDSYLKELDHPLPHNIAEVFGAPEYTASRPLTIAVLTTDPEDLSPATLPLAQLP